MIEGGLEEEKSGDSLESRKGRKIGIIRGRRSASRHSPACRQTPYGTTIQLLRIEESEYRTRLFQFPDVSDVFLVELLADSSFEIPRLHTPP
jgi:hypothetical protein